MLSIYQLILSGSNVSFKFSVFLLFFCLGHLSIDVNVVLKSPNIILLLSVSPFMSVSICLLYLDAAVLGAYIFTIISWTKPLIFMKYLCLFVFIVKPILCDMSVAALTFF